MFLCHESIIKLLELKPIRYNMKGGRIETKEMDWKCRNIRDIDCINTDTEVGQIDVIVGLI